MGEKHHVAWKDRLGLNRIWEQAILHCCNSFGTNMFVDDVELFRSLIINIKDGPQLKNIIDDYINGELKEWQNKMFNNWKDHNKAEARIPEICNRIRNENNVEAHQYLFSFMLQLLEDHGFGFYLSNDIPMGKDGYKDIDM